MNTSDVFLLSGMMLVSQFLVSCSDGGGGDDTPAGVPISFSALSKWGKDDVATRTEENNGQVSFTSGDVFGVYAYYRPDCAWNGNVKDFMSNQKVEYDGASWSYSPVKYWPVDGDLAFFAYYPMSYPVSNTVSYAVASEGTGQSPTVTWSNIGSCDIMYAGLGDGVRRDSGKDAPGSVSLAFSHKLMRLRVRLLRGDGLESDAKVTGLSVAGADAQNVAHDKATLDLRTGTLTFSLADAGSTPSYDFITADAPASVDGSTVGKPLYLEPVAKLKVSLSTEKHNYPEQIVELPKPSAGSNYMLSLRINGEGFYVTVTKSDDWNSVTLDDQTM